MIRPCATLAVLAVTLTAGAADTPPQEWHATSVTPIYGQLLALSYPREFHGEFQKTNGGFYIQESVLAGETVDHWTQMLTVTGMQNLAANPEITPQRLAERIGDGFRRHCPESFALSPLPEAVAAGSESYAVLASCGTVPDSPEPHSESALIIALRGAQDYYTVQWAERGAASRTPLKADPARWLARYQRLAPIHLCTKFAGESPPYVSCIGGATPDSPRKE